MQTVSMQVSARRFSTFYNLQHSEAGISQMVRFIVVKRFIDLVSYLT